MVHHFEKNFHHDAFVGFGVVQHVVDKDGDVNLDYSSCAVPTANNPNEWEEDDIEVLEKIEKAKHQNSELKFRHTCRVVCKQRMMDGAI